MPRKPRTQPAAETPVEEELDVEDTTTDEVEDILDDVEDAADDDEQPEDPADDVDDLEVEDVEDEPAPAPKKTRAKAAAGDKPAKETKPPKPVIEFGSAWLADHVNAQCGTSYNAFAIRTLLRKLVKDGKIQRDVGEDRSRYNFTAGAKDPVVKEVVKYVKSGAAEADKKAKLAEAQSKAKAAKAEAEDAKPAAKKAAPKAKAQPEPEVDEDEGDEEIEDL